MKKIIVKETFTFFVITLLTIQIVMSVVWADDSIIPTPTETTTPVQETTVDNTTTATNTMEAASNTGDNSVNVTPAPTDQIVPTESVSPTPIESGPTVDPSITPTPTDSPAPINIDPNLLSVDASSTADITNTVTTNSNTGANSITKIDDNTNYPEDVSPTSTPAPSQITVQTGEGVSIVTGSNTINTTAINADVSSQTINIFGDQTGNIDLSTLFQLVNNIISQDNNSDPVINIQINGVNNYAYLSNTAIATANTGGNTVQGTNQDVIVSSGNATSLVTLLNQVNLTVVNSSLHLVNINIFGHLTGNIILPNLSSFQSTTCTSCGVSFNTQNQAVVTNTVQADANTGENSVLTSDDAQFTTGTAQSSVHTINIVNQTIFGMLFENLFINDFGMWNGSFLGWDSFASIPGGTLALSSSFPIQTNNQEKTVNSTTITNRADVTNTIFSSANTGKNNLSGQTVLASTGNAYSAVSLINLINSNFLKTVGFFGFVNVFGQWDGNIGGADTFVTLTPTPTSQDSPTSSSNSTSHRENGGALDVSNSNNTGVYVLPGDTVTFFIKTKNIGSGKVYNTMLHLSLFLNDQQVSDTPFTLGDIPAGRGVEITTGLVLSITAKPGLYIAKAFVTGTTGDEETGVSAGADSSFTIFGSSVVLVKSMSQTPQNPTTKQVLGTRTPAYMSSNKFYLIPIVLFILYLLARISQERSRLSLIFAINTPLKSRIYQIRKLLI